MYLNISLGPIDFYGYYLEAQFVKVGDDTLGLLWEKVFSLDVWDFQKFLRSDTFLVNYHLNLTVFSIEPEGAKSMNKGFFKKSDSLTIPRLAT